LHGPVFWKGSLPNSGGAADSQPAPPVESPARYQLPGYARYGWSTDNPATATTAGSRFTLVRFRLKPEAEISSAEWTGLVLANPDCKGDHAAIYAHLKKNAASISVCTRLLLADLAPNESIPVDWAGEAPIQVQGPIILRTPTLKHVETGAVSTASIAPHQLIAPDSLPKPAALPAPQWPLFGLAVALLFVAARMAVRRPS
jgi:hypothetical protein